MSKTNLKLLVVFIISFLAGYQLIAQNQLDHPPKYYIDEDGKLFWNKKLPVYIRISPTPTDSGLLMKSEATSQYTNPYFLDTEGKNRIRSRWATDQSTGKTIYPQMEVIWEVYADGIAPVSSAIFNNKAKYSKKGDDFFGDSLIIEIKSNDVTSGVDQIYYSINGESYKPYSGSIKVDKEGAQTIKYYAVDKVGNAEKPKEKKFTADITPPTTFYTITGIADGQIIAISTKIYLNAEDSMSGIAKTIYKIDDGTEVIYKPGTYIPIANLEDGDHKLTIFSVDKVGNREEETVFPFYLDKTAPIIAADILGDRYLMGDKIFFSGRTKMKLTAVDNKAGVEDIFYSVNGSEFTKYDQPFYLPNIPGIHVIKYFATDKMQNNSKGETSRFEKYKHVVSRVYVDLTGPILSHQIVGPQYISRDTLFISPKTQIKLIGTDRESGMKHISYSLNTESDEIEFNGNLNISDEGYKHVVYYGYDNVNNRNRSELFVYVDAAGPEIKYNFSIVPQGMKESIPIYPPHVSLFLGATDRLIGAKDLYYTINQGGEKKYSYFITGFKKDVVNIVKIRALDHLSNETVEEIKFYVE